MEIAKADSRRVVLGVSIKNGINIAPEETTKTQIICVAGSSDKLSFVLPQVGIVWLRFSEIGPFTYFAWNAISLLPGAFDLTIWETIDLERR